eukprot:jgi/Orpsp1_1/1181248/evm.model.c7180000076438.1
MLVSNTATSCMMDDNTPVQTCIYNSTIYTSKWNHCVKIYGFTTENHSLKVFQKGLTSTDYVDVTHSLKYIKLNQNEKNPIFLLYDCNSEGCIQTSGYIKYKTAIPGSKLINNDEFDFVACYENDDQGCYKLEYMTEEDEKEGCSEINSGKIQYHPHSSHLYANFKICLPIMDNSITSNQNYSWEFITFTSNAKVDQFFTLPLIENDPFLDHGVSLSSLSQQYHIMKISNDVYAINKGYLNDGYYLNSGIVEDNNNIKSLFKYQNRIINYQNPENGYYLVFNHDIQKLHQTIVGNVVPTRKNRIGYFWNNKNEFTYCGMEKNTSSITCQPIQVNESTCSKSENAYTLIHQNNGYKYCLDNNNSISIPYNENSYQYYSIVSTSPNDFISSKNVINIILKVSKYSIELETDK